MITNRKILRVFSIFMVHKNDVSDNMIYMLLYYKYKIIIFGDFAMRISYKKLWVMLAEQEMTKQEFREKLQIASGTMTKLNKGQEVSMSVILRICEYFKCNIGDICDAVKME